MTDNAPYILGLLSLQGVGRVAASRLTADFRSAAELLTCPREQIITRLKGVPNSQQIAQSISDNLPSALDAAADRVRQLTTRRIEVMTWLDDDWPKRIDDLPRSSRPLALFMHGDRTTLSRRKIGLFARPPISKQSFDLIQDALRRVLAIRVSPVTGAGSEFDMAVSRISVSDEYRVAPIMVAACGLDRIDRSLRPVAASALHAGGLLLSSFDAGHGPFPHDDQERLMVQSAVSEVCLFIEPNPDTAEARTMEWASHTKRSVFVMGGLADLPKAIHVIESETDLDWLAVAARGEEAYERR